MTRALWVLCAVLVLTVVGGPAEADRKPGPTVVSLVFDGTDKSQERAAEVLAEHSMGGTFYVNSGYLGFPGYLTVEQLRNIARDRNEIGGASLYGNDLTTMPQDRARTQICDDRTTLAQLGFQVTSFGYPHNATGAGVKAAAQDCGYNSGLGKVGLYQSKEICSSCPTAESLPPDDDFRIRTGARVLTRPALQAQVLRAERGGGGWVPLVFTKVCLCPENQKGAITDEELDDFLTWLDHRPSTTVVRTVDQVMGGTLKPVHGTPLARLVPDPSPAVSPPVALSKAPAWKVWGLGIGQSQILFLGIALSIAMVITYRLASRGSRHAL